MSATKPTYKTHDRQISSLQEYLNCVEDKRKECRDCTDPLRPSVLFRGQQQSWTLLPKLDRYDWRAGDVYEHERTIVEEFWKMNNKMGKMPAVMSCWDKVAVAQHYGLPTRLMDWTVNPAIALWFTVKDGPAKDEDGVFVDGEVWLLQTAENDYLSREHMKMETPFDDRGRTRILDGGGYDGPCEPRIDAQEGFFTCSAALPIGMGKKGFIALESNSNFTTKLFRIPIQHDRFTAIRDELLKWRLNEWTMFLDRDNASKFLISQNTVGQRNMLR